jgi:hypothetical protein
MGSSNSKSESETINWNNIKTENVSSTLPNFNGLSNEAKQLIASLNIPSITESETSELTVNHILDKINSGLNNDDKSKFNALLEKVSSQTASEGDDLSNTSPFISSEMYEYLVNNKSSEQEKKGQKGGAKKSKKGKAKSKKGGALDDDDSDTSSTSSDSDLEDILDSTEEEIKADKAKKDKKEHEEHEKPKKHTKSESESSEMSGGELSYLSSSAHTEREFSDSDDSKKSEITKSSSESVESSSQTETSSPANSTVADENKNMLGTSESINTDDINMISDY